MIKKDLGKLIDREVHITSELKSIKEQKMKMQNKIDFLNRNLQADNNKFFIEFEKLIADLLEGE